MPIQDIVSEIQNEFQYTATGQQPRHPNCRFIFGKNSLNNPIQSRQINWFVARESFSNDIGHIGANSLEIMARRITLTFQLFSKNMDEVEEMLNDLLVATKFKIFSPNIIDVEGGWLDRGETEQSAYGYELSITIDSAIKKRPLQTITLTVLDKSVNFNDSLEVVTP